MVTPVVKREAVARAVQFLLLVWKALAHTYPNDLKNVINTDESPCN